MKLYRKECDVNLFSINRFRHFLEQQYFYEERDKKQKTVNEEQAKPFTIDPSLAAAAVVVVVVAVAGVEGPRRLWGIDWQNVRVRRICSK